MTLLFVLVLLLVCGKAISDDCEPDLADSCFDSLEEQVKYLIDVKHDIVRNISQAAVHELCLSIDDSLNCTSDVIDDDCSEKEGRGRFDTWLLGLRATHKFVCLGDHGNLKSILRGINCWNVDDFVLCMMEEANIQHVRDLLNTNIDEGECTVLNNIMSQCYRRSMSGSCREQNDISILVGGMINSFFSAYDCGDKETSLPVSSSMDILSNKHLFYACIMFLKIYWNTR